MQSKSVRLVYEGEDNPRLDKFMAEQISHLSRVKLQEMISNGEVQINGKVVTKAAQKLEHGDQVETVLVFEEEDELKKQAFELDVLYEDENVIVINKPAGLVVHPGAGHNKNTLVNALIYHWPEIAQVGEPKRPAPSRQGNFRCDDRGA
jgi:23S rRNA pseudouridine1911/1915/1917 synthase